MPVAMKLYCCWLLLGDFSCVQKATGNYALMAERVHILLPSYIEQAKHGKMKNRKSLELMENKQTYCSPLKLRKSKHTIKNNKEERQKYMGK